MTWLGRPTIAEEVDLIAAKDHDIKATADAFKAFQPIWQVRDPGTMAAWLTDWGAFWNRWNTARASAQLEISASRVNPMPNTKIIAGGWNGLLRALSKEEGHVQKGDFQDIVNRLQKAGARVDMTGTPQPHTVDQDLRNLNAADQAVRKIEKLPIAGPIVADTMRNLGMNPPSAATPTEEDASKAKWTLWAILGVIFGGVVWGASRAPK